MDMNVIKFCFIAPFLFLIPTPDENQRVFQTIKYKRKEIQESLPVAQPTIRPSHVLHIRKDLPGIISFGPIFISSVKRGIFTDHVSIHPCNGCPYGCNDYSFDLDDNENPSTPEIVELEEPLEMISVQEDKTDEEDDEIENDIVSDYNDFINESTLTSEQIYSIQTTELDEIREKELNKEFEILNQVKEVPDELEPEKEIETANEEPLNVQNNGYENVEHSDPRPDVPQELEIEPQPKETPFETQEYLNNSPEPEFEAGKLQENPSEAQEFETDSTVPQELPNEPDEPVEPVHETVQPEAPVSEPLQSAPEEIQVPENIEETSTEGNIWSGPTSPEVAQSVSEYIENHKPGEIYLCPPKDSTQISERHNNLIKSSLEEVSKRIKNYFNGFRAYAARHDDTTDFV